MGTNSKVYNKKNYKKFRWKPGQIAARAERNAARKKKWLKVWNPLEVDHIKGIAWGNGNKNLRVISRKTNRRLGAAKATAAKKKKGPNLFYV